MINKRLAARSSQSTFYGARVLDVSPFLPKMNRHLLRTLLKMFQSRLKVMQILKVRFLISCLHRFVRVRADMFLFHIVIKQSYKSSVKLD